MYVPLCRLTLCKELKLVTDISFKYVSMCKNSYVKYRNDLIKTVSTALKLYQLH